LGNFLRINVKNQRWFSSVLWLRY